MDIQAWLRDAAVFFLFMTAVQNLVPAKHYRGTIRFFLGILMLLVLGRPLFLAGGLEETLLDSLRSFSLEEETRALDGAKELFADYQERYLYQAYERELEGQIRQYAAEAGVPDAVVRVSLSGTPEDGISSVRITARSGDMTEEELLVRLDEIKRELSDVYQLAQRHIIVEVQE